MNDTTPTQQFDKRASVLVFFVVSAVVALLYLETITSMVLTWTYDTYRYGFIVFPVAIYLVWQKRAVLARAQTSCSLIGLFALAGLSFLWWIADFVGIQVIRQFSVVAMVPAAVVTIFGWGIAKEIRFALFYLIFAVPVGDLLIPYLIDLTAYLSVNALKLIGIPVIQDGRYFHVPSGSFEVAEACSGLKYFVVTLALTVLYSHVLFTKAHKAVLFLSFAMALSILANGVRATTIVLLLHYTNLDIAAGVDHEFVGLIVFSFMLVVLIWVGSRYSDSKGGEVWQGKSRPESFLENKSATHQRVVTIAIIAALAVSTGPLLKLLAGQSSISEVELTAGLPVNVDGWIAEEQPVSNWQPDYVGYSQISLGKYTRNGDSIEVALVRYLNHRQDAEVTSASNSVVDTSEWRLSNIDEISVVGNSSVNFSIHEVAASRVGEDRLIWYWTEVNGRHVIGALETKLIEIRNLLSGKPVISTAIILSAPIENIPADTRALLNNFLSTFDAALGECLSADSNYQRCSLDAPDAKES